MVKTIRDYRKNKEPLEGRLFLRDNTTQPLPGKKNVYKIDCIKDHLSRRGLIPYLCVTFVDERGNPLKERVSKGYFEVERHLKDIEYIPQGVVA